MEKDHRRTESTKAEIAKAEIAKAEITNAGGGGIPEICRKASAVLAGLCAAALLAGCGSAARDEGYSSGYFMNNAKSADKAMETAVSYYVPEAQEWGTDSYYDYEYEYGDGYEYDNSYESASESYSAGAAAAQVNDTARKIIRRVSMNVETKEFDGLIAGVNAKVAALGGYVEQSNIYNGSSYSGYRNTRNASMTVRIPQSRLDEFVNEVSAIGNVTRKTEGVDDITLSYVDTESRQKALKTEQERLLELLSKAESLEDILTIESRLSEVRYQIESYTSTLRTYDNLVDYSTVTLSVEEVKELTPVEEETAWQRMTNGFVDSLESVAEGIREFVIWFVVHIPQLIVWAAVIAIIMFIWRKVRRKHSGNKKVGKPGRKRFGFKKKNPEAEELPNVHTSVTETDNRKGTEVGTAPDDRILIAKEKEKE